MSDDLIKRLRGQMFKDAGVLEVAAIQAADALTAQAAEIERLREALAPFSSVAGTLFAKNWNASDLVVDQGPNMSDCLTFDNFLNARAALSKEGE